MNIHTYLMIKSAAGLGQPTSDDLWRTTQRALENSDRAADYKNQLDALQGNYDKANAEIDRLQGLVDNGDAERLRLIRENADLQSQYDDFYGKTKAYEDQVKREADNYRKEILGLKGQAIDYRNQIGGLNDQVAGLNKQIGGLNSDLDSERKLNKSLRDDVNFNADNVLNNYNIGTSLANTGKKLTTYGGAGIGAGVGGAAGYGLANWGGKKLGLKGNKALALNILGTTAGAGLGGYGGYRLGQYAGDRLFDTSGLRDDVTRAGI